MKQVESLFVAEFPVHMKALSVSADGGAYFNEPVFEIRTCQRTLMIGFTSNRVRCPILKRYFQGSDAYEYLLRFTCGLESEIKGETDVFGQTKTALREFTESPSTDPMLAEQVHSLFLKIFEDTKEIRTQYLQGIGGNTYGALSRKLLAPQSGDHVLIIGAGQMSKSVAPYFSDFHLKLWNRSQERLLSLQTELQQKAGAVTIGAISGGRDLVRALEEATIVILATPAGSELDLLLSENSKQKILHLGGQTPDISAFTSHSGFDGRIWSLTDLFLIEKEQSALREKQVHQAMTACKQRAILRSLARSIHISHGWEDLALFN